VCSDELTLETKVRQCHSAVVRLFPSLLHHFQPLLAPVMRLVRHEGHKTTHTHTNQGSCPPWLRPLLMSWTGLIVWHAVIGLWAFLSLRRLLWLQGLVELYGVCTHGILNIMSPSYRELLLNECTVKSSSTPSVVRTVWFEYNVPVPIDFFWGELPPLHFETQRFLENLVLYQAVRVCRLLVPSVITQQFRPQCSSIRWGTNISSDSQVALRAAF